MVKRFNSRLLFFAFFLLTVTIIAKAEYWYTSNLRIDGGGWVTGIVCHPGEENLRYIRTDVGDGYRWDEKQQKWLSISEWIVYEQFKLRRVDAIAIDLNNVDQVCTWPAAVFLLMGVCLNPQTAANHLNP